MIHYSSFPMEFVFDGYDQFQPQYEEVEVEGVQMIVEAQGGNEAKIVRLISSDPQHYLNPDYAPGNTIRFAPFISES